jgi:organic anion transporter 5A
MDGWVDGWVGGWVDGWMVGWMYGWVGGWMDGWVDGWMDGVSAFTKWDKLTAFIEQNLSREANSRSSTLEILDLFEEPDSSPDPESSTFIFA